MKKYLVTYHAPIDFMQQAGESTPEEMEKGMEAWNSACEIEVHESMPTPGT